MSLNIFDDIIEELYTTCKKQDAEIDKQFTELTDDDIIEILLTVEATVVSYSPTSRKQPPKMKTIVMTLLACKVSQFVGSVKSQNPRREVKSPGGVIVYPTFIPQLPCAAITACWYTSV